jgi:hypothetical protein
MTGETGPDLQDGMTGEDLGHRMIVIEPHVRDLPFEDLDHHPLAQEDLGVDVHGAPIVEMTGLTLAQILQTGDAVHHLRHLEIQNKHPVEPQRVPPASPRHISTPVEWHSLTVHLVK